MYTLRYSELTLQYKQIGRNFYAVCSPMERVANIHFVALSFKISKRYFDCVYPCDAGVFKPRDCRTSHTR